MQPPGSMTFFMLVAFLFKRQKKSLAKEKAGARW
jgi:hypothetical protein